MRDYGEDWDINNHGHTNGVILRGAVEIEAASTKKVYLFSRPKILVGHFPSSLEDTDFLHQKYTQEESTFHDYNDLVFVETQARPHLPPHGPQR